jgi:hypothetical protein
MTVLLLAALILGALLSGPAWMAYALRAEQRREAERQRLAARYR